MSRKHFPVAQDLCKLFARCTLSSIFEDISLFVMSAIFNEVVFLSASRSGTHELPYITYLVESVHSDTLQMDTWSDASLLKLQVTAFFQGNTIAEYYARIYATVKLRGSKSSNHPDYPKTDDLEGSPYILIDVIEVSEVFRRNKVGTQMLGMVIQRATECGINELRLDALHTSEAKGFWEAMKFLPDKKDSHGGISRYL